MLRTLQIISYLLAFSAAVLVPSELLAQDQRPTSTATMGRENHALLRRLIHDAREKAP